MEINLGNTVPLFAHDVAMSTITKVIKTKDGKAKKEHFSELVFVDSVRKTAIARIMLPKSVMRELPKMISNNLKKLREDLKSSDMPKDPAKAEIKTTGSYLG